VIVVVRRLHLTPRGVVTDDEELAKEVEAFLRDRGIDARTEQDGQWYRVLVYGIKGGDLLILVREFAKQKLDVEVWLFMSRVYPSQNE
jgi:hypothetical protein